MLKRVLAALTRLLVVLEAAIACGFMVGAWAIPMAFKERGYMAFGGEWLLIIMAGTVGAWAMDKFLFGGGKKHEVQKVPSGAYQSGSNSSRVRPSVLRKGIREIVIIDIDGNEIDTIRTKKEIHLRAS